MKKTRKKPLGRPKKPESEQRTLDLRRVRISKSELQTLESLANSTGKTLTAWVRDRLHLEKTGYGEGKE